MCRFFEVSRSGYYGYINRMDKPEKDITLAEKISECQASSRSTYGYRRVWIWLERHGIHRNPKAVLRVMNKYNLLSVIRKRKYTKYSQSLHRYPNLLDRNFTADCPNQKWVTDISCIRTGQGFLYLSFATSTTIVSLLTRPVRNRQLILCLIQYEQPKERKRSPQSCNSTVTKAFSTPREHTST